MKKKYKILFFSLLIMILSINVAFAEAREDYGKPLATYKTPIGLKIQSYSNKWGTEEKLKEIFAEFSKNYMSSEVTYLEGIYIYPDTPDGVAGYYRPTITVDTKGNYKYTKNNYIEIFNANEYNDLSEIAKVLSHEYGHHFTMYYLVTKENKYFSDWKETGYAQVRNLTKFSKVKYYESIYGNYDHRWDVTEIAAEDYVQLFGSPLAKSSVDYMDVKDRIEKNIEDYRYTSNTFNLIPQENLDIPLATEVKGLAEYWLKLSGISMPEVIFPARPKIFLEEEKLLLNKYKYYKITWEAINDNNEYEYTLVLYPEGDSSFPIPIKTVKSGESMVAYLGSYIIEQPDGSARVIMENYKGKYLLRLFIKDKNNYMFSSNEYKIDFSKEKNAPLQAVYGANVGDIFTNTVEEKMFSDLSSSHWAHKYITELVREGLIKGYSDGTYKPENTITKGEFVALTLRSMKVSLIPYKQDNAADWFIKEGYLNAAKDVALIRTSDYGKDFKEFNSNDKITREEMVFIIARAIKNKISDTNNLYDYAKLFSDGNTVKYRNELNLVVKYDIISGYPDKTFRPSNTATRAEASKLISKLKGI